MPSDSDTEITDRRERFLALLNPVYERLERFCFAMERDRDRAYDLIGETVLRAWECFDQLRDPTAFLSWLFTSATRLHRRGEQRGNLFGEYSEVHAAELRSYASPPDESADLTALYDALAQLSTKQREAIVLFEINGFTLKEIQAIQGGTIAALKVRLHRGRRELAKLLGVGFDIGRKNESENVREEKSIESDNAIAKNKSILMIP